MKPKSIAILELSLLALFVALFLWWIHPNQALVPEIPLVATGTTTFQVATFPETPIEARAAYVYDVRQHAALYQKEATTQLPLASLTKLMSALVASRVVPNYVLVPITATDIREEGDTGLYVDERWNLQKLIDLTLITSSNDGVRAIASAAGTAISSTSTDPLQTFVEDMNAMAREIGLHETYFVNQSGLDVSKTLSGGYGSARDVAHLVEYILAHNPRLVEATADATANIASTIKDHAVENTDKALPAIPNVLASKTGNTDLAGGNVVVAFNAGIDHPIIISVLGSSYDGRFADVEALASSTLAYLAQKAQ